MERYYFTFGSDPAYPYGRDDYVIAIGTDRHDCINAFRKKYPNRPGSDAVNCADIYSATKWEEVSKKYYNGVTPREILVSDIVYGCKPEGFDDIWFFVPEKQNIVYLQEGSGDNLLPEDKEAGNVDYLEITSFVLDCGEVNEDDGGEFLLPYMVQEHYGCLADSIPDVLDFLYGDMFLNAQILKKAE